MRESTMSLSKPSGGSSGYNSRPSASKEPESDGSISSTLWVGHVTADTSDADVMAVFGKHGALDCTTMHGSRSYAFVYFRNVDEAKAAKGALQGSAIRGSAIRIEFARPPKAAKQVWVGGFSSSVTKQQLEDEFFKFGKVQDYNFLRERNSAIIEYFKLEDAIAAHKNMNGKRLAGEQLRVDFLRMIPKMDLPDRHDLKNTYRTLEPLERSVALDDTRHFLSSSYLGSKRDMSHGVRKDGHPSNVLWIGYPPALQIDEQMLHNAMILFGEIERIQSFPSRHFSLVEFRSIDEARRAKEGLQGRLFNDPRIQMFYANSDLLPNKDNAAPFLGIAPHRSELFLDESPMGPLELLGPGHPMALNSFSASLNRNVSRPNMFTRPFGQQGPEARHAGFDFHNFGGAPQNFSVTDSSKTVPPSWGRRSPSAPGILPLPPAKFQAVRHMPDGWDEFDIKDTKRLRVDASPTNDGFLRGRRVDGSSIEEHPFSFSSPYRGDSSRSQLGLRSSDKDYCWRGVIAKGGAHVCYARCIPIGKGIDFPLPDIVNCSARTGLDMLTEHYAEAIGFEIVFFLPDSEEDFASYTDFLRYLGLKNRAGVAKLEDGTTLFLVPPSDFLSKVLNVNGLERLYGVVLKMPQHSTSGIGQQQPHLVIPPTLPHHIDRHERSNLQKTYNSISQHDDHGIPVDYNRSLQEEAAPGITTEKLLLSHADERFPAQPAALDQESNAAAAAAAAASQLKVSLTPDLIATLASLIPRNTQSSTSAVQLSSSSMVKSSSSHASMTHDAPVAFQAMRQEYQPNMEHQSVPPSLGQDFINHAPAVSHFPSHSNISSRTDHLLQPSIGVQIQNPALSTSQSPAVSTGQLTSYSASQSGQFSAHQSNQIYQFEAPVVSHENYEHFQTPNVVDAFSSALQQQQRFGSSTHGLSGNMPQPQPTISLPIDRGNVEVPTQAQQLQNVLSGPGQESLPADSDKNQRYQSTLQFAANLLLQIQQQQQASAHSHRAGSQQ